jgi:exopolyphosphatase/guanosine-5'-triphosphate,3'-diphosphate pyrophosphatase
MSERHFANDPATSEQIELARTDIQAAIAQAAAAVPITKAKTLVAVAGTATTVAAAALDLPEYDRYAIHLSRISASQVHDASAMFLTRNREQRLALGYMHPGRVDVIGAGSLVLSEIMKATGATEFVASESDILDGMAFSLAQG